ncbi:hypothetical protein J132_01954 [Termitomyces sp. J132]|nr:hypothetical protein C0989_007419 [Termitomyces sp. Mn162]KNZ75704.1 hypothetical protein J132_01954 [Termitomyces sp. J132]
MPSERNRKIESLHLFLRNFPHISTELTIIPRSLSFQSDPEDEIIRIFSGRWTHVRLEQFTLVDKLTQTLPCLRSLSCHLPLTYFHSPSLPATPQLDNLQLTITEPLFFRPQNLMIPFHQITTLCLLEAPWLNLTEALQQFINLQDLSIIISRRYDWTVTPLPNVILQLTSFSLIIQRPNISAQYIVTLLDSLSLPIATRITLAKTSYGRSGPWRGDSVLKFLSKSAATLTNLVLVAVPLPDGMLRKCLATTPRVQELTFGEVKEPMRSPLGKSAGSQLLITLEVPDPSKTSSIDEIILPELRSLTLEGMVSFYEPNDLIAMISSRWRIDPGSHPNAVTRIGNLTLHCSGLSPRWLALVNPKLPRDMELVIGAPSFLS